MKLLKAKVYVDQSKGNTTYSYPDAWMENVERIPAIFYPNDRSDQGKDEKGTYQVVYPIVPDDLVDAFLKLGFEMADRKEVEAYTLKHNPPKETITDQNKVLAITAKVALGATLTQTEKDSLDPLKEETGVSMSKSWLEIVETNHGKLF